MGWLCSVLVLGLSVPFAVQAQYRPYRFDHWTTDNGLPVNGVYALLQGRDGYLWMTTVDGLVRFDGVRFTVFNKGNSPGIESNRLVAMIEDKQGRLWANTDTGDLLLKDGERFTTWTAKNGLPGAVKTFMAADGAGGLVFGTDNGFYRWYEGRFSPWQFPGGRPDSALLEQPHDDDGLWFTDTAGLHQLKDGQLKHWATEAPVTSVYPDRHGALWWVTAGKLQRWRAGVVTTFFAGYDFIGKHSISSPVEDQEGNLWVFIPDQGLTRIPATEAQAEALPPARPARRWLTTADGLTADWYATLCADREGALWIGSGDKGLQRITRQVLRVYSVRDGLPHRNVYPIYEDRTGAVWLGLLGFGRVKYVDGRFTSYPTSNIGNFEAIGEDSAGRLWFSGTGRMFYQQGTQVTEVTAKLPPANVIYRDSAGNLWFGGREEEGMRGVRRYRDGQVTRFTTKEGLPSNTITVILEDRQHQMWFATRGGLARFAEGRFTSYTEQDGLASNHIRSLYEDADGVLWIGSYDNGLTRLKDRRLARITLKDGLFSQGVFQILEDARANFWMSSNQGIYRVARQQLNDFADGKIPAVTSVAYNKQDGMLNVECNGGSQPAGAKTRDGKLWFPTQDGVVVIDPEAVLTNALPPPVLIEACLVDRQPVAINRELVLPDRKVALEIQYTGLSLINSEQVKFKYRLEGLEPDWTDAGTRRTAYYTYLPAGAYTFKVIAANRDGVWNNVGAGLRLRVLRPFYQTWWFITLCALGFGGLVLTIARVRIAQARRRAEQQAAFARQLIASQEGERKRIAAELHDGLGQNLLVIKNRALLSAMTASREGDEPVQQQFNEFSDAIAHTLDEVRTISHDLRPPHLDQLGLRTALIAMIEKVDGSAPLHCTHELDNLDGHLLPDDEIMLYRIVQEGLNNILKHSGATKAAIRIAVHAEGLALTMHDNGRGFTPEDRRRRVGLGLQGIAERVRILGGTHTIQSAPGQGTTVKVRIALMKG